jgi:hypothetical protein
MEENPVTQEAGSPDRRPGLAAYAWVLSISVGLALGVGVGELIDHLGAGIAMGVSAGVVVGLILAQRFRCDPDDE